jgi:hypothetical protein
LLCLAPSLLHKMRSGAGTLKILAVIGDRSAVEQVIGSSKNLIIASGPMLHSIFVFLTSADGDVSVNGTCIAPQNVAVNGT